MCGNTRPTPSACLASSSLLPSLAPQVSHSDEAASQAHRWVALSELEVAGVGRTPQQQDATQSACIPSHSTGSTRILMLYLAAMPLMREMPRRLRMSAMQGEGRRDCENGRLLLLLLLLLLVPLCCAFVTLMAALLETGATFMPAVWRHSSTPSHVSQPGVRIARKKAAGHRMGTSLMILLLVRSVDFMRRPKKDVFGFSLMVVCDTKHMQ